MLKPKRLVNKNFLSSLDISKEEFLDILDLAKNFKNKTLEIKFKDKVLGLIFDKSSTRTRVSFQVAMSRLGGTTIDLNPNSSQISLILSLVIGRLSKFVPITSSPKSSLLEFLFFLRPGR